DPNSLPTIFHDADNASCFIREYLDQVANEFKTSFDIDEVTFSIFHYVRYDQSFHKVMRELAKEITLRLERISDKNDPYAKCLVQLQQNCMLADTAGSYKNYRNAAKVNLNLPAIKLQQPVEYYSNEKLFNLIKGDIEEIQNHEFDFYQILKNILHNQ